LVAWDKVNRPKIKGGLGVLDLEKFSRALRLRWLWYTWVDPDRPWVGSVVPCSEMDQQLFRCSTIVTVGDGAKAQFWNSSWVRGHAPRDLAPNLYRLAWRKGLSVRQEIENGTWTRGLWRMLTAEEMAVGGGAGGSILTGTGPNFLEMDIKWPLLLKVCIRDPVCGKLLHLQHPGNLEG